jgi:hypothetical protein
LFCPALPAAFEKAEGVASVYFQELCFARHCQRHFKKADGVALVSFQELFVLSGIASGILMARVAPEKSSRYLRHKNSILIKVKFSFALPFCCHSKDLLFCVNQY